MFKKSQWERVSGATPETTRRRRVLPKTLCAAGFSLVEVMVAILILGVVLVGLTQGISTALGSNKESEWQTTAVLFAAGQIELLRAKKNLADGETEGACGEFLPAYRWKQKISPTDIDGLHEVTVVVAKAAGSEPIYELKTLLFDSASGAASLATNAPAQAPNASDSSTPTQ